MTRDEAITRLKNMAWLYGSTEREQNIEAIDMAIEALSADRPTVDKEYLIDLIQEAVYDGEACEKLIDLADRPTGEWIPVSERLPKRGKDVLVTRKYYGKDDCNKDSIYVEISACYADGEEWCGYSDEYKMNPKNHKVIAWMPLPEPYKGGDDSE